MKKIELLFRGTIEDKIQELKDKGAKIWSISRINNYNGCPRGYYYTYVDKKPQNQNIYAMLGSAVHEVLEDLYTGKTDKLEKDKFEQEWIKAELFGVNFASEKIKINYKKDIDTFFDTYKKMDGEFVSELGFILHIKDNHYMTGFIDNIQLINDETINIFDFKTSAVFKGDKLQHAGRQLVVYALAMKELYGLETNINAWEMLKYMKVTVGGNKPKVVEARQWVDKCKAQIKTLMKNEGYGSELLDLELGMCAANNSIDTLPQPIKDKIKFETHVLEYEVTDEIKAETMRYITDTIDKIVELNEKDISCWKCEPNKFFCEQLCSFYPKHCKGE